MAIVRTTFDNHGPIRGGFDNVEYLQSREMESRTADQLGLREQS